MHRNRLFNRLNPCHIVKIQKTSILLYIKQCIFSTKRHIRHGISGKCQVPLIRVHKAVAFRHCISNAVFEFKVSCKLYNLKLTINSNGFRCPHTIHRLCAVLRHLLYILIFILIHLKQPSLLKQIICSPVCLPDSLKQYFLLLFYRTYPALHIGFMILKFCRLILQPNISTGKA